MWCSTKQLSCMANNLLPTRHRSAQVLWTNCSAPDRRAEYCDERVCLSVGVYVCPRLYLRNYTSDLHQIFSACYLWPWLGPPLAAWWYAVYFRFYGWRHIYSKPKLLDVAAQLNRSPHAAFGLAAKCAQWYQLQANGHTGLLFGRLK